jgi:AraC-like DNA-binding protein
VGKLPTREEAEARYPHGTFARYKLAACTCLPCRLTNVRWWKENRTDRLPPWQLQYQGHRYVVRNRYEGTIDSRHLDRHAAVARLHRLNDGHAPTVSAARWHVEHLRAHGMGLRTIADRAGVSRSTLQALLRGDLRRPFRRTLEWLVAVTIEPRGGAVIDAGATWEQIGCLRAAGWKSEEISHVLGNSDRHLQIGRKRCTAQTATRVRALHDAAWRREGDLRRVCSHSLG